jgi:hypothetical protein
MPSGAHEYYEALGVPRTASTDEIRAAHRKLARQYHPDFHPGDKSAEERFKNVQEAYDVLIDADARRVYDQTAFSAETGSRGTPAGTTDGTSPQPATGPGSFEHREWMRGGAAGSAGPRDFDVPRSDETISVTTGGLLGFFLACGIVGARLLPGVSGAQPLVSLGWEGSRVLVPIAILFAMGFLFGGTRGNFLARCMLVNAGAWCCLVLYCRTGQILQWTVILHMLPWALPAHTPIILGMFLRRGTTN